MIEDELRAVLTRHEDMVPPAGPVLAAIDAGYRRRRRRRLALRAGGAVLVAAALLAVPAGVVGRHRPSSGPPVGAPPAVTAARPPAGAVIGTASPGAAPVAGPPLNLVLVGVDDTVRAADPVPMVLHVTASGDRAYLVSLDGVGGPDLSATYRAEDIVAATRKEVTWLGARASYGAAAITLSGAIRVIDALGGVRFCPETGCRTYTGAEMAEYLRQQPPADALSMTLTALLCLVATGDRDHALAALAGNVTLDGGGRPLPELLDRLRGIGQLIELRRPDTAADRTGLFEATFGGDLDAYVISHPQLVRP